MNSYKDPFTPLIANPVNIDRPIQELQKAFATLGWLQKSFGRAYESRVNDPVTKKVRIYPQVWQGQGYDLLNVLPNDNLESQSFMKVEEPIEAVSKTNPGMYSHMRARISCIFWFNLERIDKTIDYSYAELLKGSVQRAITNVVMDNSSVQILKVWETAKNVFSGYTLDEVRDQELIYPCGGFRFECELLYIEDCPDSVYNLPS